MSLHVRISSRISTIYDAYRRESDTLLVRAGMRANGNRRRRKAEATHQMESASEIHEGKGQIFR
ncbi:hypothetical protein EYF80_061009 [Liparis tanakae]|uniref:Uncharacterized protein n=1 Tax=Liparis tanakae TaxID=230148 RepID=A0A4Z2EJ42_9TELE|nr:hypothetical protein EYF80_061009 [Liparis tanakae]